jgi:hypothetical protein
MRNRWLLALAGTAVLAVVGLIVTMATDERGLAFTLGVRATQVATVLKAGDEACQRPIDVPADADSVEFQVGTFHRPGQPIEITVRSASGLLGNGRLPGGYPDNSRQSVKVDGIEKGERISLCVHNAGRSRLALYGGAPQAARTSAVFLEGREQPADLTLIFQREPPRSMLSLLPAVFERASLFHPGWVEDWLFWLIAAVVALGVPLTLALAMSSAGPLAREDRPKRLGG